MVKPKHLPLYLLSLFILFVFIFFRLYKITNSFLFFGDPGRDFLVLENWLITHKPPLLGPQTSALPFNQSAIYFYLLMPLYLITGKSLFSTIYTYVIVYSFAYIIGFLGFRHKPRLLQILLVSFYLISLQPQYIIQGRYIWNPSFVPLCVGIVYFFFYSPRKAMDPLSVMGFGPISCLSNRIFLFCGSVSIGGLALIDYPF